MYCPNCGRKIDSDDIKFCPNCGRDLSAKSNSTKSNKPQISTTRKMLALSIVAATLISIFLILTVVVPFVSTNAAKLAVKDTTITKVPSTTTTQDTTPAPATTTPTEPATTPSTSSDEIDPNFFEEGFWINDIKDACNSNAFAFADKWKGKRILVDGYVYHMDSSAFGSRYIVLRPYDFYEYEFDMDFHITCFLEGDGGNLTQYIDGNNYCNITGEIDIDNVSSDSIYLRHCYVYSVE